MPQAMQANLYIMKRARDVMDIHIGTVPATTVLQDFARLVSEQAANSYFLVENRNIIIGFATKDTALGALNQSGETITLGEVASQDYITLAQNATLFDVIAGMRANHVSVTLVTRDVEATTADNVLGLITKCQIGDTMEQAIEVFSD
jgi:predicted transcriptional regulator